MNIKEGIEKRFSVRAFTDEVPKLETIKEILKTANAAPSGGNIQPWKVYVLSEEAKKRLAEKTYIILIMVFKKKLNTIYIRSLLLMSIKKEDMNVV